MKKNLAVCPCSKKIQLIQQRLNCLLALFEDINTKITTLDLKFQLQNKETQRDDSLLLQSTRNIQFCINEVQIPNLKEEMYKLQNRICSLEQMYSPFKIMKLNISKQTRVIEFLLQQINKQGNIVYKYERDGHQSSQERNVQKQLISCAKRQNQIQSKSPIFKQRFKKMGKKINPQQQELNGICDKAQSEVTLQYSLTTNTFL